MGGCRDMIGSCRGDDRGFRAASVCRVCLERLSSDDKVIDV